MPFQITSINIDRNQAIPLSRQLYMQLHHQILHGQITYKERLPATRLLASELELARGVVVECYEMLKTDGLVAGYGKAGTQVCYRRQNPTKTQPTGSSTNIPLSLRGKMISAAHHYSASHYPRSPLPLTPGVPDFSLFPYSKWQSLSKEALQSAPAWYQRSSGVIVLKQMLQNYLAQYRGIHVLNLSCLLITSGTQAALSLLARMLADPGDTALIDQPSWSGAKSAIEQAGLKTIYAPVDEQGTELTQWVDEGGRSPKIIIITPGAQFPTGRPMSTERREDIIRYSTANQVWLIEDDYAPEYSYAQHPVPSILAHSTSNQVIHLGTMSKMLLPSLRLGWMVVPEHIAPAVNSALNTLGIQPPYMLQQQLGRFMQYGYFSAHLAHTRTVYNERHRLCKDYIHQHEQDWLTVMPSISGMNHYLHIDQNKADAKGLEKRLRQAGLGCEIYTQSNNEKTEYYLLLGHANLQETDIAGPLDKLLALHGKG